MEVFLRPNALLALEDGSLFRGTTIGHHGDAVGEVVFNTAMTGYQEILTDPSYCKQIVTLTYPHIGNTGINSEDWESSHVHVSGLIIRDYAPTFSNWRSQESLSVFLIRHQIVAIADVDTRKLTRHLREQGALSGCIMAGVNINEQEAIAKARAFPGLKGMDLADLVSTKESYHWNHRSWQLIKNDSTIDIHSNSKSRFHVVVYDFGVKHNILRMLVDRNCRVTVVPAKTSTQRVMDLSPDGVLFSNGPGDPETCNYGIASIQELLNKDIPLFGICLGHQLLAIACGAKAQKMKFGHHGANHPVQDLETKEVIITSQNHGFAIDEQILPNSLQPTHRSLFDGTLQGVKHKDKPAFGFQGHPEASPGPHDIAPLFDRFIRLMQKNNSNLSI
ncbi:glutamine-hydrolyzing carbamoyl-phosphate synthase small subunit [Candidatus Nitrosacidococcus tergens]|uniref:Carbamoyl phosphate synthase small chain n=1 Tax=Candidatus Nitrosacidococcus tergens TaxID=553981 RepID=A0A7G1Q7J3_9GAMM|nr:glutamine-hydrolyzing carbamoyl-phosphate synthase small subunit [Candidatus Nitrosacidococcus tergens]CAB1274553.1 carbamoyl-phosphate synthase, small subunit [Candidatus Nitrosacidococcus tergens]